MPSLLAGVGQLSQLAKLWPAPQLRTGWFLGLYRMFYSYSIQYE